MQGSECVRDQTVRQIAEQHPGQTLQVGPTIGSGGQVEVQRIEGKVVTQYETPYAATSGFQGPIGPVAVGEQQRLETLKGQQTQLAGSPAGIQESQYKAAELSGANLASTQQAATTEAVGAAAAAPPLPTQGLSTGATTGTTGYAADTQYGQTQTQTQTGATTGFGTSGAGQATRVQLQAGTVATAYETAEGWKAVVPVDVSGGFQSGQLGRVFDAGHEAAGALDWSTRKAKVQLQAGSIAPLFETRDLGFVAIIPIAIQGSPVSAQQGSGAVATGLTSATGPEHLTSGQTGLTGGGFQTSQTSTGTTGLGSQGLGSQGVTGATTGAATGATGTPAKQHGVGAAMRDVVGGIRQGAHDLTGR